MPQKWWRTFGDAELDSLIEHALTGNFSLLTAWDRLAQAEAIARKTYAALWPQVDLSARGGRTRQENDVGTTYSTLYSAGVAASYEVDLWSQLASSQKAARLDVEAGREAVDTAAITLSASIAGTWYQLAEAKELVRIAEAQTRTNEQVLKIVTARFKKGIVTAADVLRQRQLVASTEARMIAAEETVQLVQYRLSVLSGVRPTLAWQEKSTALPDLPPMPELGLPTEVLWHRPDVRQDYRSVQAADQRMAAAIADQYPRLSISTQAETSSASVHDLFDDWLANLAANAFQPLLDGAQRKAEVRRQEAILSEAIHDWGQTILDALEEVEGALTRQQQQAQLLENLRVQLDLARQTYQRNRESYIKGGVDYIRVLESLVSLQALERSEVTAERTLIQSRIDLYRSIAGRFDLPQPQLVRISDLTGAATDSANLIQDK
jgi:NodT family efflux transporter outer membrane factor (OMF) lipoprotein